MLPITKILCPIDFSDASLETLRDAVELALHFKAALLLVHVFETRSGIPPDPLYAFKGPEGYKQEQEVADEESLQRIIEQRIPKEVASQAVEREGNAADEIARTAQSEGIDLIIMATHGLSGWRHLVFGSVTEKVLRQAPCAVLVKRIAQSKKGDGNDHVAR
jgi:universal stress protein A